LEKNLAICDTVEDALINSFVTANSSLESTPIKYMTSGSTCVGVYVRDEEYWVANVGDSRAVIATWDSVTGELVAHSLSRDHKPDDPEEKQRIEASGGFVSPAPLPGLSSRVYLDPEFTMIGLAMARSLGTVSKIK
jgi:serine/threonine protein phosphatase PrpC